MVYYNRHKGCDRHSSRKTGRCGNMRKAIRFSVDTDTVAMEEAMELASIVAEAELKKAQAKADAQVRANSDFEYLSESDKAFCNLIAEGKVHLLESWKKGTLTDKQIEDFSNMERTVYGVTTMEWLHQAVEDAVWNYKG